MTDRKTTQQFEYVEGVVLDWAGTTVDFGSRAPALVFQEIFEQQSVSISIAQARGPMGMAKREHIAAIAAMPDVAQAWLQIHGGPCQAHDIDRMYEEFLPLQKKVLSEFTDLIPGVTECVDSLRAGGLQIGSSTGYTRELMEIVSSSARDQGYAPDFYLCSEDAPRGRPAPFLLHEAAKRMDVYPMWRIVKVDDTTVGIQAGRNAGCWTIGVSDTGNLVGLSAEDFGSLSEDDRSSLSQQASEALTASGAHYVVASVADIPAVIRQIDGRCARGDLPTFLRQ